MAKKKQQPNEEDQKKKKKGLGKKIGIAIIIIVVLIASIFFAIINGIVEIIKAIVGALIDFFSDPIGFLSDLFASIGNAVGSLLGTSYTRPTPNDNYMAVYIDNDAVEQIREGVSSAGVDVDEAGLTDSMLKAIVLAYYSTFATEDTFIYTPIDDEDEANEILNDYPLMPMQHSISSAMSSISGEFVYILGYGSDFLGEDGQLYLATKGTVKPVNAEGEQLEYYDMETFLSIAEDFENAINSGYAQGYIESFFDDFNEIYTIAEGASGSITVLRGDTHGLSTGKHAEPRVLDYRDRISKYAMPIELLVDMLEITASPEFIEETIKLVESSSIEVQINQSTIEETETYQINYSLIDHNNADSEIQVDVLDEENAKHYISADYSLSLKSVNCWYCTGVFDTEKIEDSFYNEDDETETFDFDSTVRKLHVFGILRPYDMLEKDEDDNVDYDFGDSKSAINIIEGTVTSYSETTETHEANIQPFLDILKTEFTDLYIEERETAVPGDLLTNGAEMFFELLEQSENTAQYVNVMKYILYKYSDIDFGVSSFDEVFELFSTTRIGSNYLSVFGTNMNINEFIDFVQEYGDGERYANLSDLAESFYNICQQEKYNINPCLAFAWACIETRNGSHIEENNLFGMAEGLGSSELKSYTTPQNSITDFCDWIIEASTEGTEEYNNACEMVEQYAPEDEKFGGNPHNNVYVLFINYPYVERFLKTPEQRVATAKTEINRRTQRTKAIFGDDSILRSKSSLVEAAWEVADHYYQGPNGPDICYAGNSVGKGEATRNGRYCPTGVQNSWNQPLQDPSHYGIVCATFVSLSIWKAGLIDEDTISRCGMHGCSGIGGLLDSRDDWLTITNWNDLQDGDVVWTDGHIWIYLEGGKVLDQKYCVHNSSWKPGEKEDRGSVYSASCYAGELVKAFRYVGR